MEDLEDEQIEELKQKAIERVDIEVVDEGDLNTPAPAPPKKSKKVRSEAQKAAFEKAKLKRAENIKLRQKQREEQKAIKKETKIKIKQILQEELEQPKEEEELAKPQPKLVRQESRQIDPASLSNLHYPHHQPAPVNNYYYYGAPPQHHYESEGGWLPQQPQKSKKKKPKKPRPPTPSSSEEEEVDEPETYKDLHNYSEEPEPEQQYQAKIPKFKFSYA